MDALLTRNLPSLFIIGSVLSLLVNVGYRYWKVLKSVSPDIIQVVVKSSVFLYYARHDHYFSPLQSPYNNRLSSLGEQLLPSIPYINAARNDAIKNGHSAFAYYGYDVISWVSPLPAVEARFLVADPLAIKTLASSRSRFPKNTIEYDSMRRFGSNILVIEGDAWKRQRKVVAPSFSEKNNRLVWDETIRLTLEVVERWGSTNSTVHINDCLADLTLPLALFVIGSAGFGRRMTWSDETGNVPRGHTITFTEALHITSLNMIALCAFPKWVINMSKSLREAEKASEELGAYFREMIEERKSVYDIQEQEHHDLFSALIAMNMGTSKDGLDSQLTDEEVMGNIFIFILAGHETSAHTLCFVLGLLAIEQEEQEKMHQHIISIIPDQKLPVIELAKITVEDSMLPTLRPNGSIEQVFVPANTEIRLDTVGTHYNPRYWPDPMAFKPSRFMEDYNRDAFVPFSVGSRACIGRGFSETEMVAVLTLLIKLYRVELKDEKKYQGLTKLEQRELLLPTLQKVTTTLYRLENVLLAPVQAMGVARKEKKE
ncbi:hypothetical protein Clacol_001146 [Clathrus columnatus]|uniref:Cytochrome P450 n=1 Tax=Clathrus columnatus TaxID=1419009 RepID=A0AAV5A1R6_9AGAM|nr:hypothetical protein Clacol_001146 [Clathrus columnatus]